MKLLILIMMITFNVQAESFKIAGEILDFKEREGLVLKGCEKSCEALKVIKQHKKIDLKKARVGMDFTNSIGSDVCDKVYKAQSLLGSASNKDRRAFCFFKDKSMVEMDSLSQYLVKNKIVTE
jgi:hypothetical protein